MSSTLAQIWTPDALSLRLILPELLLLGAVVAILLSALVVGRSLRVAASIAVVGVLVAALASLAGFGPVTEGGVELFAVAPAAGQSGAAGMLSADRLSFSFRLLLIVFLLAIVGMWLLLDAPRERYAPEFLTLLLCSAIGMMLMTSTLHLLLMVIAIELASQPSYGLTAWDRLRRPAAEAGVKYAVFGAATTGFMLFGVSLLFGQFGTLHLPTLAQRLAAGESAVDTTRLTLALLLVFAGVGFKISAVPFHFWCPDAFQGASLPVATWLSVASKAAGVVLLLRLVGVFVAAAQASRSAASAAALDVLMYGVGFFGLLTCTFANLAAYWQNNVRRLLAYSSIAHAGYMLCAGAIVVPAAQISSAAVSAVVAYLIVYLFMNLGAFLTLGLVAADSGSEELSAFRGLGWRDAPTAVSLTVILVSLVGLPPLGGFVVKWWLIYALGSAALNSPFLWVVVGGIVLNTALSLYYYARIIREMWLVGIQAGPALAAPVAGKFVVHVCAVVLLLTGTIWIPALKRGADFAADRMYVGRPVGLEVANPLAEVGGPSAADATPR